MFQMCFVTIHTSYQQLTQPTDKVFESPDYRDLFKTRALKVIQTMKSELGKIEAEINKIKP